MIEIDAKISLSKEQIEKIIDDYIQKNTKFMPDSFKFNVKKEYGGFGYGNEQHVFDGITVSVKLKD